MTGARALLADLAARGIVIELTGSRLRLRPRSALTESLISRIVADRSELLALLSTAPRGVTPPSVPPLQWFVLWALARRPEVSPAELCWCLPAPQAAVEDALTALLARRELRARANGGLEINAC